MINHEAVYNTHSNAVVIREDIAYDSSNEAIVLDVTLITAETTRLQTIHDAQAYSRSRATAYAALNQDEMRFDDVTNSTTTWVDAINAIKEEFPK